MAQEIPTPLALLHQIGRSDEYLGTLSGIRIDQLDRDERVKLRARAVGMGALALAKRHTSEGGYVDTEGQLYNLISTLQPFLEATVSIEKSKQDGTYRRSEHQSDIAKTIDFNNGVKEVIDHNPRLSPDQLSQFLESTFITSYGKTDSALFLQASEWSIYGMKNELGFEQIASHIDGLSLRSSTKKEELTFGADYYVTLNDLLIPIDIKSDRWKAEHLNEMSSGYDTSGHSYKMWSHCQPKDFTDSFRLPNTVAQQRAAAVRIELLGDATMPYRRAA